MAVAHLSPGLRDPCFVRSAIKSPTPFRVPLPSFSQIGSSFAAGSPLVISKSIGQKKLEWKAKPVSVKCEHSSQEGKTLDVWLRRLPMVGFAVAASFEAATIKGLLQFGEPAYAVTGDNNYEVPLSWILIQLGIIGFFYFLVMPPIIMNWLRIRWYRRNLLEMYLQFMFVFLFFPGVLLWAPFLNFRRLPRDPSMKYPWSTPKDPSKIKSMYLKYPFAKPEDYDW